MCQQAFVVVTLAATFAVLIGAFLVANLIHLCQRRAAEQREGGRPAAVSGLKAARREVGQARQREAMDALQEALRRGDEVEARRLAKERPDLLRELHAQMAERRSKAKGGDSR
jgi:hypothetical protein